MADLYFRCGTGIVVQGLSIRLASLLRMFDQFCTATNIVVGNLTISTIHAKLIIAFPGLDIGRLVMIPTPVSRRASGYGFLVRE